MATSLANFSFNVIGKEPDLLKRLSGNAEYQMEMDYEDQDHGYKQDHPSSTEELQIPLSRPTLLQALSQPDGLNMDGTSTTAPNGSASSGPHDASGSLAKKPTGATVPVPITDTQHLRPDSPDSPSSPYSLQYPETRSVSPVKPVHIVKMEASNSSQILPGPASPSSVPDHESPSTPPSLASLRELHTRLVSSLSTFQPHDNNTDFTAVLNLTSQAQSLSQTSLAASQKTFQAAQEACSAARDAQVRVEQVIGAVKTREAALCEILDTFKSQLAELEGYIAALEQERRSPTADGDTGMSTSATTDDENRLQAEEEARLRQLKEQEELARQERLATEQKIVEARLERERLRREKEKEAEERRLKERERLRKEAEERERLRLESERKLAEEQRLAEEREKQERERREKEERERKEREERERQEREERLRLQREREERERQRKLAEEQERARLRKEEEERQRAEQEKRRKAAEEEEEQRRQAAEQRARELKQQEVEEERRREAAAADERKQRERQVEEERKLREALKLRRESGNNVNAREQPEPEPAHPPIAAIATFTSKSPSLPPAPTPSRTKAKPTPLPQPQTMNPVAKQTLLPTSVKKQKQKVVSGEVRLGPANSETTRPPPATASLPKRPDIGINLNTPVGSPLPHTQRALSTSTSSSESPLTHSVDPINTGNLPLNLEVKEELHSPVLRMNVRHVTGKGPVRETRVEVKQEVKEEDVTQILPPAPTLNQPQSVNGSNAADTSGRGNRRSSSLTSNQQPTVTVAQPQSAQAPPAPRDQPQLEIQSQGQGQGDGGWQNVQHDIAPVSAPLISEPVSAPGPSRRRGVVEVDHYSPSPPPRRGPSPPPRDPRTPPLYSEPTSPPRSSGSSFGRKRMRDYDDDSGYDDYEDRAAARRRVGVPADRERQQYRSHDVYIPNYHSDSSSRDRARTPPRPLESRLSRQSPPPRYDDYDYDHDYSSTSTSSYPHSQPAPYSHSYTQVHSQSYPQQSESRFNSNSSGSRPSNNDQIQHARQTSRNGPGPGLGTASKPLSISTLPPPTKPKSKPPSSSPVLLKRLTNEATELATPMQSQPKRNNNHVRDHSNSKRGRGRGGGGGGNNRQNQNQSLALAQRLELQPEPLPRSSMNLADRLQ